MKTLYVLIFIIILVFININIICCKENIDIKTTINSYNSFVIISLKDCASCYFDKIKNTIKILENTQNNTSKVQIVVKEKINDKELKILKKKYKSDKIIKLSDINNEKLLNIKSTPYLVVLDNDSNVIYEKLLFNIQTKFLNSILHNQLYLSKTFRLKTKEEILNISKVIQDINNDRFLLLDNVQDKIFSININNGKVALIYSLDKSKEYIKPQQDYKFLKKYDKPLSTIESFFLDKSEKNSINVIIKCFETKAEINKLDTTINFLPSLILLKANTTVNTEKYIKILSHGEYYFDYEYIFNSNDFYYVTGKNMPNCNNFPFSEVADSTYVFYKFLDNNFDNFKSLLSIKSISNITNQSFYSFFASDIITENGNDFVLYSTLNRTFVSFKLIKDNIVNIKNIIPKGELKLYFENVNDLNLTPKSLIENSAVFKINCKYIFKNMLCSDSKIGIFFIESNKKDEIITNKIQFYNFEGKYLNEFTLDIKDKDPILESKMIRIDNEKVYLLNKYESKGWCFSEYYYQ